MLFSSIFMLVCSAVSVFFGLVITFTKKPPLYFQLIVFAMTSQLFSRIYFFVSVVCYSGLPDLFNVGFVGYGTFMLSLAIANSGHVNKLVDDGRKRFAWYRIIPVIIPIAETGIAVYAWTLGKDQRSFSLSFLIISLIAGIAGYYNLKLLIIPDVKNGIARSTRLFNAICLIAEILTLTEIEHDNLFVNFPVFAIEIPLGILYMAMLPLLYLGVQKWKQ